MWAQLAPTAPTDARRLSGCDARIRAWRSYAPIIATRAGSTAISCVSRADTLSTSLITKTDCLSRWCAKADGWFPPHGKKLLKWWEGDSKAFWIARVDARSA